MINSKKNIFAKGEIIFRKTNSSKYRHNPQSYSFLENKNESTYFRLVYLDNKHQLLNSKTNNAIDYVFIGNDEFELFVSRKECEIYA